MCVISLKIVVPIIHNFMLLFAVHALFDARQNDDLRIRVQVKSQQSLKICVAVFAPFIFTKFIFPSYSFVYVLYTNEHIEDISIFWVVHLSEVLLNMISLFVAFKWNYYHD